MKRHIVFFSLIVLTLNGCGKMREKALEIQHDYEFNQDISTTNRIVIRTKKPNQTEIAQDESSFHNNFLETKSLGQVKFLDSLLSETPKTDYCCCPNSDYSIALFNNKILINTYYADTLQFKNKVRIYEASYQYSLIIEKGTWKKYLGKLDRK